MSFINTIEDDSDQVELIVRQRLEAKPGCSIVGFDQFDQAGAVTELSTQLSSNSSRIDGIITSLSDTDANVIALNSNLLAAIANTASNTVTNASLVSDLRSDVDSNSALTLNLQANTIAIAADLASNSALVSGLRTDLSSNATLLSNATARITVVEQNTSNLSNLTNTVTEHTTDILNLEQSVNLLDSIEGALDGNSSAITALSAAGVSWGLTIFNSLDKAASKVRVGNVESVLETQFGDDLANLTSGNTASDVSADISALKDVVNLELWGNLLGADVVLSSPSNIGAPLTSNIIIFNDALFGTSNTSTCHNIKSNVSSLQAFQNNTATTLGIHNSNISSLNQSIITIETDLGNVQAEVNTLQTDLTSNVTRISALSSNIGSLNQSINTIETDINSLTSSLTDNSTRITTVSGDLASNVSRIQQLESAGTTGDISPSNVSVGGVLNLEGGTANDTAVNSGNRDNTYIRFALAGTSNDWAYLRQIGGNNQMKMALDFHDDSNDCKFLIRGVHSSGQDPDVITTRFSVVNDKVGVGLSSPAFTLDVDGVSRSRGVVVNSGFGNNTARPALSSGSTHPSYEIRSIGGNGSVGSTGADDGFLRLRAGGGSGTNSASYIDLSGYSTYSGNDMKRNIVFGTLGTERMRIKENGYVGVAVSNPTYELHVDGNAKLQGSGRQLYFDTGGAGLYWGAGYSRIVDDGNLRICTDDHMHFNTGSNASSLGTERMCIRSNGCVGIGTGSPSVPLHVAATTSASVGETHRWVQIVSFSGQNTNDPYDRKFGYTVSNTQGGNYDYSIKASGAVGSTRFIIKSDERIKKDIVDVSDDEALVKLRMLHPKKYRYIDESARGDQQVYGYLANEVQYVLPDAILEHPEEVPSIYQLANVSNSSIITFSDFDTSKLQSNTLVAIGIDQLRHKLTVDEIIDSTSVRVIEDLSALSGSLDEHGNAVTDTQTLSITPEEYDELEDKTGFEPISDDSNVITEYTKTTTTYVGDQLFVYGEVVDDFKHLQESAISTLSTAALQEVDRIQQQHDAQIADLEAAVTSRDQQIDELRSELSDIVSRLEAVESG